MEGFLTKREMKEFGDKHREILDFMIWLNSHPKKKEFMDGWGHTPLGIVFEYINSRKV